MNAQEVVDPEAHLYVNVDALIVATIRRLRAEHGACTMRSVASQAHIGLTAVSNRCRKMAEKGILHMTEMPGSLRVADEVEENGAAVWLQQRVIEPPSAQRPVWQDAIVDYVIEASAMLNVEHDGAMAELGRQVVGLVPKPAKITDEQALAIAHQLELANVVPAEPAPVLDAIDELLRIEALGGSTEVPDLVNADGELYDEDTVIAKMAEALAVPDTPMTKIVNAPVAAAQKATAKNTKRADKPKHPPKATRTPEQQAVIDERMRKVREARATKKA